MKSKAQEVPLVFLLVRKQPTVLAESKPHRIIKDPVLTSIHAERRVWRLPWSWNCLGLGCTSEVRLLGSSSDI